MGNNPTEWRLEMSTRNGDEDPRYFLSFPAYTGWVSEKLRMKSPANDNL